MKDKITISKDNEQYYLELEELGLVASGVTIKEAFCNLGRAIEIARHGYLKVGNLTEDAIKLKSKLMEIFEEGEECKKR